MKQYLFISLILILFASCQSDSRKEQEFAGTYEVTLDIPGHEEEIEKARKEMKQDVEKEMEKAREEIQKAKEEINRELGEESGLGKAIGNFVEGMGKLAEGMAELGTSLGEMGIHLGTSILEDIRFEMTFQEDGTVDLGRYKGIDFETNDELQWKIEGDRLVMWSRQESKDEERQYFQMEEKSDGIWVLTGEDVVLNLKRREK